MHCKHNIVSLDISGHDSKIVPKDLVKTVISMRSLNVTVPNIVKWTTAWNRKNATNSTQARETEISSHTF